MATQGHATTIVEDPDEASEEAYPKRIGRSEFVAEVSTMMQRNRGRELHGTFNPLIAGELFTAQCQPWKDLAQRYVDLILAATRDLLHKVMEHVADEVTGERLLRDVIEPSMSRLKGSVQVKLEELLAPHLSGHPITYNHYLTENTQKA